jgi:hypothetical protein
VPTNRRDAVLAWLRWKVVIGNSGLPGYRQTGLQAWEPRTKAQPRLWQRYRQRLGPSPSVYMRTLNYVR